MALDPTALWSQTTRQIQLITADLAEGVIFVDVSQAICWANGAALDMHGVESVQALGSTIDEYYANFRVKFHKLHTALAAEPGSTAAPAGISRELLIEVTLPHRHQPERAQRVRNVVLIDEAGRPGGIILIIRPNSNTGAKPGLVMTTLDAITAPTAIMRLHDQSVVDVNEAFLQAAGLDKPSALTQATVQLELYSGFDGAVATANELASPPVFKRCPAEAIGAFRPILHTQYPVSVDNQDCLLFQFSDLRHQLSGTVPAALPALGTIAYAELVCAAAPAPVQVLDVAMCVQTVSEPWIQWLGYTKSAVIGRHATDFLSPASAEEFKSLASSILKDSDTIHQLNCQFVSRSGAIIEASLALRTMLDAAGDPRCVIASSADATERRRSEERFEKLFAMVPMPMLIRRLDNARIIYANAAFLAATGYAAEAVLGRSVDEVGLFENRTQRQQFEHELRANGRLHNMDVRIKGTLGETMDCVISGERIHVQGQPCTLLLMEDVTDRRRNETQLFQAIETVMADTSWFSRSVIEKLAALRAPPRSGGRSTELCELTPREREVLGLISHGLSDIDIADKLRLTRSTVRNHVATLYSKIGVHSRSSAIVWARERGINIAWPSTTTPNFMRPAGTYRKAENLLALKKNGA
jgi:PAS domain S-box-containing protein